MQDFPDVHPSTVKILFRTLCENYAREDKTMSLGNALRSIAKTVWSKALLDAALEAYMSASEERRPISLFVIAEVITNNETNIVELEGFTHDLESSIRLQDTKSIIRSSVALWSFLNKRMVVLTTTEGIKHLFTVYPLNDHCAYVSAVLIRWHLEDFPPEGNFDVLRPFFITLLQKPIEFEIAHLNLARAFSILGERVDVNPYLLACATAADNAAPPIFDAVNIHAKSLPNWLTSILTMEVDAPYRAEISTISLLQFGLYDKCRVDLLFELIDDPTVFSTIRRQAYVAALTSHYDLSIQEVVRRLCSKELEISDFAMISLIGALHSFPTLEYIIIHLLEDPIPNVQKYAIWILGTSRSAHVFELLSQRIEHESDPTVIGLLNWVIDKMKTRFTSPTEQS